MQGKANRKQNVAKTTASKPSGANRKQTEEITYVIVLTGLVQGRSVHEVEYQ